MSANTNSLKKQGMGIDKNAKLALDELQGSLKRLYGKNTPRLMVYGSYIRGQATEASDIDVLLLYPSTVQPGREIARLSAVLADLNLRYQVLISVVPATEEDYRCASGAFWRNVREEGLIVEAT